MSKKKDELESVDAVVDSLMDDVSEEKPKRRSWKDFTVDMAREYYEEHYSGMSPKEVSNADSGFYAFLSKKGWRNEVFTFRKTCDWSGFDLETVQEHYEKNFPGMSPAEVAKADLAFSMFLRRKGWQDEVITVRKRQDRSGVDLETAKEHYETNFPGKTRREVQTMDNAFYQFVSKKGWQDEIFPESAHKGRGDWSDYNVEKTKAYYEKHCQGLSRQEVQRQHYGFYQMVRNRGWLDEVFPGRVNRDWSGFDLEKSREYYQEHHAGKNRRKVYAEDRSFYEFLSRKCWRDEVFPPLPKRKAA